MRRVIVPMRLSLIRFAATVPPSSPAVEPAEQLSKHARPLRGVDLNRLSFVDEVDKLPTTWRNPIDHPVWSERDVAAVAVNHKPVKGAVDMLAYALVQLCRWSFDTFSGHRFGKLSEVKVLRRVVFLETVAGVPGMIGGMLRHMSSLRRMQRDGGWIHTQLEESENERMHLLTFMALARPGLIFRAAILIGQGFFFNFLFVAYLVSPRFVHRFVGFLEEEAVITYTKILHEIDAGTLPQFAAAKCPPLAREYWRLSDDASLRDMFAAVRADEAGHRLVNHTFADMHAKSMGHKTNPFIFFGHCHGAQP